MIIAMAEAPPINKLRVMDILFMKSHTLIIAAKQKFGTLRRPMASARKTPANSQIHASAHKDERPRFGMVSPPKHWLEILDR
jgi:hypothetical protein